MGKKAQLIIDIDRKKLIELLNKAYADEWLAYYQYWVGSKVASGPLHSAVAVELAEHAQEELNHANMLADRILKLGGIPLLEPKDWYEKANCGYEIPSNSNAKILVEQNLKGERCAIEVYKKLLDLIKGKDLITERIVLQILEDEVEHEEDLENILDEF